MYFSQKGVHVAYLGRTELRERFPDMNFDGIVAGTYGTFRFHVRNIQVEVLLYPRRRSCPRRYAVLLHSGG